MLKRGKGDFPERQTAELGINEALRACGEISRTPYTQLHSGWRQLVLFA